MSHNNLLKTVKTNNAKSGTWGVIIGSLIGCPMLAALFVMATGGF